MKKLLLLSASCLMLLSACKKDNNTKTEQPKPEEKKYDVTFKVDGFIQAVTDFTIPAKKTTDLGDTLKNYADNFVYRIFNADGVYVNGVNQKVSDVAFGTVSDKLPSGTYTVWFAAAKGYLFGSDPTVVYSKSYFSPSGTWGDTFAKSLQLTVGNTAVTQSVRLDRVVGGLEVTLEDAIPTGTAKISISYKNDSYEYYLNTALNVNAGQTHTKDFALAASDIGQKNKKFLMHVGNTKSASSVLIRAYDANGGLLAERTIDNVQCYKNTKTLLTGSLFSASSGASAAFSVVVNPTWATPGTPIKF
jgi:hypothetical protein